MSYHDGQTTSSTGPREDWEVVDAYLASRARLQETMDARAVWLGYRGEADFTDRAAAQLDRHPTLPKHLARHARFVYLGTDK